MSTKNVVEWEDMTPKDRRVRVSLFAKWLWDQGRSVPRVFQRGWLGCPQESFHLESFDVQERGRDFMDRGGLHEKAETIIARGQPSEVG